jgi:hypothetical protein
MDNNENIGKVLNSKILVPSQEELERARKNYLIWQRSSPNNFSYWFPKIKSAEDDVVKIPMSRIVSVPEDLLEAFFMDGNKEQRAKHEEDIKTWISKSLLPAIEEIPSPRWFLKNGCFSGKFKFSESCLLNSDDEETVYKHVMSIQGYSLLYDTNGNLEMVVREFIEPAADTPEIYNGMPLRPEVRWFYDFDKHKMLYGKFYWDWDHCHEIICKNEQDKIVYENVYSKLHEEYERLEEKHFGSVSAALSRVGSLSGIWSVDFILEENRVWLIDMALGECSAYYDPSLIKAANE